MQNTLLTQKCIPCNIGTPPLTYEEIEKLRPQLKLDWEIVDDKKIQRDFSFKNFKAVIAFVNKIADLAEHEGHHPDLYIHDFKKLKVELWTHKINGLSENDFILAAKIEKLLEE